MGVPVHACMCVWEGGCVCVCGGVLTWLCLPHTGVWSVGNLPTVNHGEATQVGNHQTAWLLVSVLRGDLFQRDTPSVANLKRVPLSEQGKHIFMSEHLTLGHIYMFQFNLTEQLHSDSIIYIYIYIIVGKQQYRKCESTLFSLLNDVENIQAHKYFYYIWICYSLKLRQNIYIVFFSIESKKIQYLICIIKFEYYPIICFLFTHVPQLEWIRQ